MIVNYNEIPEESCIVCDEILPKGRMSMRYLFNMDPSDEICGDCWLISSDLFVKAGSPMKAYEPDKFKVVEEKIRERIKGIRARYGL